MGVVRLRLTGSFVCYKPMAKNMFRFYQAWELRQQGKKLREIAQIMGFKSGENARRMISHIDFKVESKLRKSKELLELIQKYRPKKYYNIVKR